MLPALRAVYIRHYDAHAAYCSQIAAYLAGFGLERHDTGEMNADDAGLT